MLKRFVISSLFALAFMPAAFAQNQSVTGQVESINPANRTLNVKTADGTTRTYGYLPGTVEAAKLTEGSNVVVDPKQAMTGTVVEKFRNFIRIQPDAAPVKGSGDMIEQVLAQPPLPYEIGDRVVILPNGQIEKLSRDVYGYLAPGDITQAVSVAQQTPATTTQESTTTTRQETQQTTTQPVQTPPETAPAEQAAPVQQPVQALW